MSDPTRIEVHSEDALRRLSDFLRGKAKIASMLRAKGSARIDVKEIVEGTLQGFFAGNCLVQATSVLGETPATLSSKLRDMVNDPNNLNKPATESFEGFPCPGYFVGEGAQGTWGTSFGPGTLGAWPISDLDARSGSKSLRLPLPNIIPPAIPGEGPLISVGAVIQDYRGRSENEQTIESWFRFEPGFPNVYAPSGRLYLGYGPGVFGTASGFALVEALLPSDQFYLGWLSFGGPGQLFGPYSLAAINDGNFHKFTLHFFRDGSLTELYIDETFGGALTSPPNFGTISAAALLTIYQNTTPLTLNGAAIKTLHVDDLTFGLPGSCAVFDSSVFYPAPAESLEELPLGDPLDGEVGGLTWTEDPPGGETPPSNYLGGFIATDEKAHSGTKSVKTIWSTGGFGFDPEAGGLQFIQAGIVLDFPGMELPRRRIAGFVALPVDFPNVTVPEGVFVLFAPLLGVYSMFGSMILSGIAYDPSRDVFFITIGIPGYDEGFGTETITIPRASIADGNFHEIIFDLWVEDGIVKASMTVDAATLTRTLSPPFTADLLEQTLIPLVAAGGAGESYSTFYPGDFYLDDFSIGGSGTYILPNKALKRSEDDDHLYIYSRLNPGADLKVGTFTPDTIGVHALGVVDQVQELEDTFFAMLEKRGILSAEGAQLDMIGKIVGLARATGQSDEEYRNLLEVQIQSNLSKGEIERLITIVKAFTNSTKTELQEFFPAYVQITYNGDVDNPSDLLHLADAAAAGGVKIVLLQVPLVPFVFEGDDDGLGFDEGEFSGSVIP